MVKSKGEETIRTLLHFMAIIFEKYLGHMNLDWEDEYLPHTFKSGILVLRRL